MNNNNIKQLHFLMAALGQNPLDHRFISMLDDVKLQSIFDTVINEMNSNIPAPQPGACDRENPLRSLTAQLYYAKRGMTNFLLVLRAAAGSAADAKAMRCAPSLRVMIQKFLDSVGLKYVSEPVLANEPETIEESA